MKKYILTTISIMFLLPVVSFSDQEFFTASPSNAKTGIIIVPLVQMSNPESIAAYLEDQKTKGYSLKESDEVKQMIKESHANYLSEINNISDPKDTHMKSDLSKIQLAFKYKGVPFLNSVGYAPGGTYIPNAGWTVIGTFFNDKEIGACEYRLNNMKLAKGAVLIPQESVRYDINNKVTNIFIEGSKHSGFMYNVTWNDETYNHFLICANLNLDNNITNRMIELAKKIDKTIS